MTHYHDDHVDAMPALQAAFDCPTLADAHVAPVINAAAGGALHFARRHPRGSDHNGGPKLALE
ncbi:MAG: hypothetical protein R2911_41890 [Caldilineaceae bacterium]